MIRGFVQTKQFEKQLKVFSKSEELLSDIEQEIFKDLKKNISLRDVISGTGGFTKIRIAFKAQSTGKSSSARVIYFDSPQAEITFLMMIYSKSKLENISEEGKKSLKKIGQELKTWRPKKK